jgi:beta-N-acetylhexosaminidase
MAARIAAAFDDRQLAAQVIISGIDGRGRLTRDMRILLTDCPAGGIMLFRYNLNTDNDAIRNMIDESVTLIGSGTVVEQDGENTLIAVPPFVAVDHEGGKVNRFRPGVADLPPAGSYWETSRYRDADTAAMRISADSYHAGRVIGGLGVNLNFAPVAEYLNGNNTDFLKDRSYGTDPSFVTNAAAAFIAVMEAAGVLCVVKHFPGSAGADPHYFPSVMDEDREALAELTAPFESLIRGGRVRALMVSHSVVPALDAENTASLSPAVMDEWLRRELGFNGIIICDDFSMGAVSLGGQLRPETAAVRSLAAGADMVLVWPPDLRRTHREIQSALKDGRLSRERLREAAGRIVFEKIKLGMIQ